MEKPTQLVGEEMKPAFLFTGIWQPLHLLSKAYKKE
jgi:hypothetical protein